MKKDKRNFLFFLLFVMTFCSCSTNAKKELEPEVEVTEALPVINLDEVSDELKEMRLSQLVDDLEIIPLETNEKYLLNGNPMLFFNDNFLLAGVRTSFTSPIPGRLYHFDRKGKFVNEIGQPGKGPGGHIGFDTKEIRYYQDDSTVMVRWGGSGEDPQMFNLEGKFLGKVKGNRQYMIAEGIERWSDSLWFAPYGNDWAYLKTPLLDTVKFAFFDARGKLHHHIPKTDFRAFPENDNNKAWLLGRKNEAFYQYKHVWKYMMRGNDTLYRLVDMKPVPEARFPGRTIEDFPPQIWIYAETENALFMKVSNRSDMKIAPEETYFVIDKLKHKAHAVKYMDDILFVLNQFDKDFMSNEFGWCGNEQLYFVVSADTWLVKIKPILDFTKLKPEIKEKLKILDAIKEDDNPIIFSFSLKSTISFNWQ